ncbi:MAG TPA: hypothetical protein VLT47_11200 [Anaeromyxobacteraceae bacterium]|nr:hypothetical protein [Anaeromyxobacteraceae bacterium]
MTHDDTPRPAVSDGAPDDDAQPGVSLYAVSQVLAPVPPEFRRWGLVAREPGTPNRARFVSINGGDATLAILTEESR